MTSITIHNLDDNLKQHLRLRTAEHGRSIEEEVCEILRLVLGEPIPPTNLATAIRSRIVAFGGADLSIFPHARRCANHRHWIRGWNDRSRHQRPLGTPACCTPSGGRSLARPLRTNSADIYLTAISEAELRYDVAIVADGK